MSNQSMPVELFKVSTISEIARIFKKHRDTVKRAVNEGRLDGRLSSGTWLVSIESAIKLWGKPYKDWS